MSLRFGIQLLQMWFTDLLWTLQGTLLKVVKRVCVNKFSLYLKVMVIDTYLYLKIQLSLG